MKNKKGITIILILLITTSHMLLALYILNFSLTEKKIANSQALSSRAYYLSESGINEIVWLIKNDPVYKNYFETDGAWATTTARVNPFGANSGSYAATITNTSPAHGEIISVGTFSLSSGQSSQRRVKTLVYRPVGQSGVASSSGYADGNINISSSKVNFLVGDAHSNNVFDINNSSIVNITDDLKAVGNYIKAGSATVNIGGDIFAANYANGPAAPIAMPAVDFNSASANSYKNKATTVYSEAAFDNLMDANQVLTLTDPITYVTGDVELKGAQTLILDKSLLVVENDFTVGFKKTGHSRNGPSNLYITHATNSPSGILSGRHATFNQYTGEVDTQGIIYATDQLNLVGIDTTYTTKFDVVGGLVSRKLTITSCWQPINITHDNQILVDVLGTASSSQTIIIEHWEEEY